MPRAGSKSHSDGLPLLLAASFERCISIYQFFGEAAAFLFIESRHRVEVPKLRHKIATAGSSDRSSARMSVRHCFAVQFFDIS